MSYLLLRLCSNTCCSLFAVFCSLFVVQLFAVRCLLFGVCCSLFDAPLPRQQLESVSYRMDSIGFIGVRYIFEALAMVNRYLHAGTLVGSHWQACTSTDTSR